MTEERFVHDIEFGREQASKISRAGPASNIGSRWDRIHEEVRFDDVVAEFEGTSAEMISCPFHGRDSHPSFRIYWRSNSGYCFGCPEGEKYWDSVRFVARKLGYSNGQAIRWLEKKYKLPPLEDSQQGDSDEESEDDVKTISLSFEDLSGAFKKKAAAHFLREQDPAVAREYVRTYFDAMPRSNADRDSNDERKKLGAMARILGSDAIEGIKRWKWGRS